MLKTSFKNLSWDFYSKLIIIVYALLQILRWRFFPQFLDMHYHILTAWGFIQAGGYSGWDFWQYAPFGRPHIYPPFFHILLAFLIKSGASKIILAKLFEAVAPILFFLTLWQVIRRNFSHRLAFFTLLAASSSFSFYLSLINNIPATLAIILGLFIFDRLLKKEFLRPLLLLTLCFYTHIGISWLIAITLLLYGLFDKEYRKPCLRIFLGALILSSPILFKQLSALKFLSRAGGYEKYFCEFKTIDYLLALLGVILVFKREKKYRLFLGLFLASLVFLLYPYRFFSAQGYLPIIFLAAFSLDFLYEISRNKKAHLRCLPYVLGCYILFLSPTLLMEKPNRQKGIVYKVYFADSALTDMMFPARNKRMASTSLWFAGDYLSAAEIIRNNSKDGDIIYATLRPVGVSLGGISGRATASALFPEIGPVKKFDPVEVSAIIITTRYDNPQWLSYIVGKYSLVKLGENKLFVLYKNPAPSVSVRIKKASLPFWLIWCIGSVFMLLYWKGPLSSRRK